MTQQLVRTFAPDDVEQDEVSARFFEWSGVETTRAAIAGSADEAARLTSWRTTRTASPAALRSLVLPLVDRFVVDSNIMVLLNDSNFAGELARLLFSKAPAALEEASVADLGAPKVDVLLGAVDDLTAWTGMTKDHLSKYVGISSSTVMSWRRVRPENPRHKRIPVLLSLWSAVSGAHEEFGTEEAARMVWAAGATEGGAPAIPAVELAEWIVSETSEANLADFLEDDGFVPGTAPLPDLDELTAAEARLHESLVATASAPSLGR